MTKFLKLALCSGFRSRTSFPLAHQLARKDHSANSREQEEEAQKNKLIQVCKSLMRFCVPYLGSWISVMWLEKNLEKDFWRIFHKAGTLEDFRWCACLQYAS